MIEPRSLWAVIPAYNEAKSIGPVVSSLRSEGYQVVVVDDGSRDETAETARSAGAIVLRHELNLGQGGALQTGITFSIESGAQFICTFDADGQHCATDIAKMRDCLIARDRDIVLGSRFLGESIGISRTRKLLLKMAILFTRAHSGLQLTDAHNGLRVMTAQAASRLRLTQLRMAHASEIIDEIARQKLRYCEVPVTIVYTDYSKAKGQSGFASIRIIMDLIIGRMMR
jgi:glycosyltransferase involved in cell wall biosynthesis